MYRTAIIALSALSLFFVGVIVSKSAPMVLFTTTELKANQAKDERAKLEKQAQQIETELYLKSPDGRKSRARIILRNQFPGWCDWSSAEMAVRSNGDVYARCNGATFAVSASLNIAMRSLH
jgi:hypothetical protein